MHHGEATRPQIAADTGLSKPTVGQALLDFGTVRRCACERSECGSPRPRRGHLPHGSRRLVVTMEVVIRQHEHQCGVTAVDIVVDAATSGATNLGLATGSSPLSVYPELIRRHRRRAWPRRHPATRNHQRCKASRPHRDGTSQGGGSRRSRRGAVAEPLTASCPASVLQLHPHVTVVSTMRRPLNRGMRTSIGMP